MTTTTLLAESDIGAIVRETGLDALMDEAIASLTSACESFSTDRYSVPQRSGFHYSQPVTGLIEWMPAMQRGSSATVKLVTYHPLNPSRENLPTILSSVLVFDTATGHLRGILDGTFLTALRTGAASAVASAVLANPDSSTIGIIGCGAQAITQLHALSRRFDLETVLLHDTDPAAIESFRSRLHGLDVEALNFKAAGTDEIVRRSDILCTCTSVEIAEGPVFTSTAGKSHLHVNAVGSDFPGKTELPRKLLARSLVVPDFQAQAVLEGECQQLREDEIGPDLAELVKDSDRYARYRDRPTVFDSTGWALEDHVVGQLLIDIAKKRGFGSEIRLESLSADPRDPYGFAFEALRLVPGKKSVTKS